MKKRILLTALAIMLSVTTIVVFSGCPNGEAHVCSCTMDDLFLFNPYRNVDFATVGQYRADFHVHTSNSDGTASPDETARRFASVGFDFLSFTEHDSWIFGRHSTRPGVTVSDGVASAGNPVITNFNLNSPNTTAWVQTWPWSRFGVQDGYHGLIPIQGNEVTRTQHFANFYTSFTDQTVYGGSLAMSGPGRWEPNSKRYAIERAIVHSKSFYPCDRHYTGEPSIEEGQVRFEIFHPERDLPGSPENQASHLAHLNAPAIGGYYQHLTGGYYRELIRDFPTILSMEVFNQADRHPSRHVYDNIMRGMFPQRPLWMSANSDDHGIHFGYSANIMLLTERSEQHFRRAREQGAYFAVGFAVDPNLLELDYEYRHLAEFTTNANGHHWTHAPHLEPRLSTQRWGYRWNYTPTITDIIIDCCTGYITVEASGYTNFEWITEDGVRVAEGNTVNFRTNDKISNYVRGQLTRYDAEGNLISTKLMQPFGVGQFCPDSWFFHFTGLDVTPPTQQNTLALKLNWSIAVGTGMMHKDCRRTV